VQSLRESMTGGFRMLQVLAGNVSAMDGGHRKSIIATVPVPIRDAE
jgi:hypothetical protein